MILSSIKNAPLLCSRICQQKLARGLQKESVVVKYIIVQDNALYHNPECVIYNPADNLPFVDLVIVTSLFAYEEIKDKT